MTVKERINLISNNSNISIDTPYTTAKIELTGMCTLNCSFCYNEIMSANNERQKLMSREDFDIIVDAIDSIKTIKEVGLFYMGESGLHPMLCDFYKILKDRGFFTYLTTNGTTLKNVIKAIPYIDSLKVSWNYKNEQDFIAKTRSNSLMYQTIIKNINTLNTECLKNGKVLTVSTILDSEKTDYEYALSELSYGDHYWLPLQSQAGICDNGLDGVLGVYENKVNAMPCWSLFKGFYVDVDLNIRCCCYGHSENHIIGNLKNDTINNILSSEKIIKIKKDHLDYIIPDICKKCLKNSKEIIYNEYKK